MDFVEGLKGLPILDFLTVGCIFFAFLDGSFSSDKFKRSPLNYFVLGFYFAMVFSNLTSFSTYWTTNTFKEFSGVAVVYLLIIFTVDTMRKLKILIWAMVFCTILLALQGILLKIGYPPFLGGEVFVRQDVIQVKGVGIFADPNDLAMALVCFVPFLMPAFHKGFMARNNFLGLPLLVTQVAGVLVTLSRGGILGLAMVGWYYFKRRVGTLLTVGIMIVLFYALLAVPRMGSIDPHRGSGRGRLVLWGDALYVFTRHPVFGMGVGLFPVNYFWTAHNSYLLVLAETGLFGTFFWLALFYSAFREIYYMRRLPRPPPYIEQMCNAFTGSLIGWLVCGFFLSQSYKHLSFILLALVVAGMNILAQEGYEFEHRWTERNTFTMAFITVLSVPVMWLMVRLMWIL